MITIGGWQKVTLIDYPGKVAASIFLAGCNFRCVFCHNPDLLEIKPDRAYIPKEEFFQYLQKRRRVLEGVCLGGGEPLLNEDLPEFLQEIRSYGYLIKIDTNGSKPQLLQKLIEQKLIDYVAMDIKASLGNYSLVTGVKVDVNKILGSIKLIMSSGLDYEFRTTVLPKYHSLEEIEKIAKLITGAKQYYLQNFINKITLDPNLKTQQSLTEAELLVRQKVASQYVEKCLIRN
jgi:pyruvate formate lyase activating enzyme